MIRKNLFSIMISIAIFWLSMASFDNIDQVKMVNIPYMDKIVHFGMYFALMTSVLYENRKNLVSGKKIFMAALFPLSYGVLIELLQSLTESRSASFFDAVADFAGIIVSVSLWHGIKPFFTRTK